MKQKKMYHLANRSINMSGGRDLAYKVVLRGTSVHTKYQRVLLLFLNYMNDMTEMFLQLVHVQARLSSFERK